MVNSISPKVKKVAKVIHLFTKDELKQLVCLVPQLREIDLDSELIENVLATEYFRRRLMNKRNGKPLELNETFIGELTYGEYLNLSEEDKNTFWDNLFAEEEIEINNFVEYDVKTNARVSTRQKRGAFCV